MFRSKPNHCISLRRNMSCSSNPMRNAITSSTLVALPYYPNHTNAEEHDMFRSKPNHCISLRRNMPCSSLYLFSYDRHRLHSGTSDNSKERPFIVESLVAFLHYLNHTNTRRARCAPNKHYEIPFVRGMPCSSLCTIQLRTPQTFIEKTSDGLVYDTR